MTTIEVILGGMVVSIVSGVIGKSVGDKGKVSESVCEDHRDSCSTLLCTKIDGLSKRIDELKKAVDGKLLGI